MRQRGFWLVFALVLAWKIVLFAISAQPIPANDAFFYDGAVIHYLEQGGYYNPCVAQAFPISGTQVFSNYPPLYQLVQLGWMTVFGTSALSAMGLHIFLFGCYMGAMLAIFRRLKTPVWCVNLAAGFFLLQTFHDRPDTLAHVLGMSAIYAWVRSRRIFAEAEAPRTGDSTKFAGGGWGWLMAFLIFLAFCTSLQIGATYLGIVALGTIAACHFGREKLPVAVLAAMVLAPIALALIIKSMLPLAWAGFMQNVHQTPFLTGWRTPSIAEMLKAARSVPALFLILVLLPMSWFKQRQDFETNPGRRHELVLVPLFLGALGITIASQCVIAANTVGMAIYFQPLVVACYLAICAAMFAGQRWLRIQVALLSLALLVGSVRAIGMSTWGLACAADVGYAAANRRVEAELAHQSPGKNMVMSSAFLYGAVHHTNLNFTHCDWMEPANGDSRITDIHGLKRLRPPLMVLTQFDYYRRFEPVLEDLKTNVNLVTVRIENTAHTRAPDSMPSMQRFVQHISWAPVIVQLDWHEAGK